MRSIACCVCGTVFSVDDNVYAARLRDGKTFYCPNGQGQSFAESDASQIKKLKRQLADAHNTNQWWENHARHLRNEVVHLQHVAAGMKGRLVQEIRKGKPELL